ncbi:transposase [Brevifollis gellanilyticus]|nr:transposase [Brevifollis gellanilyticus]
MYRWRRLDDDERRHVLAWRQRMQRPLHSPRHVDSGQRHYLITATCFEHSVHIGYSLERMNAFTEEWLQCLEANSMRVAAWVVLPNHYHALVASNEVVVLLQALGRLHGRTSFEWNGLEQTRGRQVWCNAVETVMKSSDHHAATLNYIHHNPVKHDYVLKWTDWPWSSATEYLSEVGRDEAERLWKLHPIERYGAGWDDPEH